MLPDLPGGSATHLTTVSGVPRDPSADESGGDRRPRVDILYEARLYGHTMREKSCLQAPKECDKIVSWWEVHWRILDTFGIILNLHHLAIE